MAEVKVQLTDERFTAEGLVVFDTVNNNPRRQIQAAEGWAPLQSSRKSAIHGDQSICREPHSEPHMYDMVS